MKFSLVFFDGLWREYLGYYVMIGYVSNFLLRVFVVFDFSKEFFGRLYLFFGNYFGDKIWLRVSG